MTNQNQRPVAFVEYDPSAFYHPNGTRKTNSCNFWARGACRYTASVCHNAHGWLANCPEGPRRAPLVLPPFHENRQDQRRMPANPGHGGNRDLHAGVSAPGYGPLYATSETMLPLGLAPPTVRSQLDHIAGMSLLDTAYVNHQDSRVGLSAPGYGPVYANSETMLPLGPAPPFRRSQLDHMAGMSLLDTALFNSNQARAAIPTTGPATASPYQQMHGSAMSTTGPANASLYQQMHGSAMSTTGPANASLYQQMHGSATSTTGPANASLYQQMHGSAMPAVHQAQVHSGQQHSRLESSPGSPFNPAAPIFRSVLQPNREAEYRNKSERLLRALDEQNAVIVAIQEELVNTASDLICAIKDMREVAKSLQKGQSNGVTDIKKLAYRSADLETVVKRQEDWGLRLAQVTMPNVSRA